MLSSRTLSRACLNTDVQGQTGAFTRNRDPQLKCRYWSLQSFMSALQSNWFLKHKMIPFSWALKSSRWWLKPFFWGKWKLCTYSDGKIVCIRDASNYHHFLSISHHNKLELGVGCPLIGSWKQRIRVAFWISSDHKCSCVLAPLTVPPLWTFEAALFQVSQYLYLQFYLVYICVFYLKAADLES